MINKILLPIDGSEYSKKALEYVVEIAEKFDSLVILVNSYEMPSEVVEVVGAYKSTYSYLNDLELNMREYGDNILKDSEKILKDKGLNTRTILLKGEPGEAIVICARDEDCDMIVMGSRGLGTIKSVLIGSVSDYVVHHTKRPVLLIH